MKSYKIKKDDRAIDTDYFLKKNKNKRKSLLFKNFIAKTLKKWITMHGRYLSKI